MLDVVLKADKKFQGPYLGYIAVATFLHIVDALNSRSLVKGFSRMQRLSARPITAGSFPYVVAT